MTIRKGAHRGKVWEGILERFERQTNEIMREGVLIICKNRVKQSCQIELWSV